MNSKKCKRLRRYASLIAGDKYDSNRVYKILKATERNYEATMARLRVSADKSMECSKTILEGDNDPNT